MSGLPHGLEDRASDTPNPDGLREVVEVIGGVGSKTGCFWRVYVNGCALGYDFDDKEDADKVADDLRAAFATSTPGDAPEGPWGLIVFEHAPITRINPTGVRFTLVNNTDMREVGPFRDEAEAIAVRDRLNALEKEGTDG